MVFWINGIFRADLLFLVILIFDGHNWVHSYNQLEDDNLLQDDNPLNDVKLVKHLKQVVKIIEKVLTCNNSAVLSSKQNFDKYVMENLNELMSDARVGEDHSDFYKILPLTTYCGPGNWVSILSAGALSYRDGNMIDALDQCCELHDKCNEVLGKERDIENYPGLSWTYSFFTRLHCTCDVDFFNCLNNLESILLASSIKWIYSVAQPQCFKKEYPIVECNKTDLFVFGSRCTDYKVNNSLSRTWQWFDIPYPYSNILDFPRIFIEEIYDALFLDSSEYDFGIVV